MWTFELKEPVKEPPILLQPGQKVYKVIRGDIETYTVLDRKGWTWKCGYKLEDRGYTLCNEHSYGVTWNSHLGKYCFLDFSAAKAAAERYISSHDVLCVDDMRPVKTVAYSYYCRFSGERKVMFYSELDNGMIYVAEWCKLHFLADADKKDAVIKHFMEQEAFDVLPDIVREENYEPVFRNMYLTGRGCVWERMEYRHQYYCDGDRDVYRKSA